MLQFYLGVQKIYASASCSLPGLSTANAAGAGLVSPAVAMSGASAQSQASAAVSSASSRIICLAKQAGSSSQIQSAAAGVFESSFLGFNVPAVSASRAISPSASHGGVRAESLLSSLFLAPCLSAQVVANSSIQSQPSFVFHSNFAGGIASLLSTRNAALTGACVHAGSGSAVVSQASSQAGLQHGTKLSSSLASQSSLIFDSNAAHFGSLAIQSQSSFFAGAGPASSSSALLQSQIMTMMQTHYLAASASPISSSKLEAFELVANFSDAALICSASLQLAASSRLGYDLQALVVSQAVSHSVSVQSFEAGGIAPTWIASIPAANALTVGASELISSGAAIPGFSQSRSLAQSLIVSSIFLASSLESSISESAVISVNHSQFGATHGGAVGSMLEASSVFANFTESLNFIGNAVSSQYVSLSEKCQVGSLGSAVLSQDVSLILCGMQAASSAAAASGAAFVSSHSFVTTNSDQIFESSFIASAQFSSQSAMASEVVSQQAPIHGNEHQGFLITQIETFAVSIAESLRMSFGVADIKTLDASFAQRASVVGQSGLVFEASASLSSRSDALFGHAIVVAIPLSVSQVHVQGFVWSAVSASALSVANGSWLSSSAVLVDSPSVFMPTDCLFSAEISEVSVRAYNILGSSLAVGESAIILPSVFQQAAIWTHEADSSEIRESSAWFSNASPGMFFGVIWVSTFEHRINFEGRLNLWSSVLMSQTVFKVTGSSDRVTIGGEMSTIRASGIQPESFRIFGGFEMPKANVFVPRYKGEVFGYTFELEECGTDYDIQPWTFRIEFRNSANAVVFSRTSGFTNTGRKTMEFSLSSAETSTLPTGDLMFLLWRTDSSQQGVLSTGTQKII